MTFILVKQILSAYYMLGVVGLTSPYIQIKPLFTTSTPVLDLSHLHVSPGALLPVLFLAILQSLHKIQQTEILSEHNQTMSHLSSALSLGPGQHLACCKGSIYVLSERVNGWMNE